ncbi:MAG: hypothetical protein PWQ06_1509 [Anaerophaga sp.]|nr:hypothetical protein [Anaerophaga sp.]
MTIHVESRFIDIKNGNRLLTGYSIVDTTTTGDGIQSDCL